MANQQNQQQNNQQQRQQQPNQPQEQPDQQQQQQQPKPNQGQQKTAESKPTEPRSAITLGVLLFHERMLKAFQGRIDQRELNQRRTLCRIML